MEVRHPQIDLDGVTPAWFPNGDFAHTLNAMGIVPSYIEPYLIKVLRQAKERLDPTRDADLIADIEVFVRQEAQHFKLHNALNRRVREAGYERMGDFERAYAAIYERLLAQRSLRWNLAYSEGFEAIGAAQAGSLLAMTRSEDALAKDPAPLRVWKWHLAEEYEHRTVAYRAYHTLFGHPAPVAYLVRVAALVVAAKDIFGHTHRLRRYLIATDRADLPPQDQAAARKRTRAFVRADAIATLRRLVPVLSPRYDPADLPEPPFLHAVLDRAAAT